MEGLLAEPQCRSEHRPAAPHGIRPPLFARRLLLPRRLPEERSPASFSRPPRGRILLRPDPVLLFYRHPASLLFPGSSLLCRPTLSPPEYPARPAGHLYQPAVADAFSQYPASPALPALYAAIH